MASRDYWSMTEGAWCCLIDSERSLQFGQAIRNTIRTGDVVVDAGTGSGLLAMLAARSGAKRVYAVENDPKNLRCLRETFAANGLSQVISVVEGDAVTCALPESVDVIICEMVATALIEELQVPAMNNLHRFASPRARVLLQRMRLYVELVESRQEFYGLKFPIPRYEFHGDRRLKSRSLGKRTQFAEVDFSQSISSRKIRWRQEIEGTRAGIVNGLRLTTETTFWDGSCFGASFAYAYPLILPLPAVRVRPGDRLLTRLNYDLCGGFENLRFGIAKH